MEPHVIDLTISLDDLDTESLLQNWKWLVPKDFIPIQMSKFGHWFFIDPSGKVFNLDLIEGELLEIAPSVAEYNSLKNNVEMQTEWFLDGFVFRCETEGLRLDLGQCYGWRLHPMIGGKFKFENIQVFSLSVYQSLMGQLFSQWK